MGLKISYSFEGRDHGGALETAGGIAKALPLLGDAFWVVSGDVYTPQFVFDGEHATRFARRDDMQAYLWLMPNPPHHPTGDFGVDKEGRATRDGEPRYTWSSIGLFRAAMFKDVVVGTKAALRPHLDAAIAQRLVCAEVYRGAWTDVGTPERLAAVNAA